MRHFIFLVVTILLAFSLTAYAATDNATEYTAPIPEQSLIPAVSISTKIPDIPEDSTLVVRVIESPEIDTRLTFCAVIISAVAVLFSAITLIVSVRLQIKHNRDEVRPIIAIHLDINDMSIKIKNHGVGPAIFKAMIWKDTQNNISTDTLEKLLVEKWNKLNYGNSFYIYTKPFLGNSSDPDILAPQEELFFMDGSKVNQHPMTQDEKRALGKTFRDIEVQITYTDLYGRNEWTLIKNLSFIASVGF